MLGFRPLSVAKRKTPSSLPYTRAHSYSVSDAYTDKPKHYGTSSSDSDYDDIDGYSTSSPVSSRAVSESYTASANGIMQTTTPRARRATSSRPRVSAYSYRNPRAFTRYLGLAIGTTLLLFMLFLTKMSWASVRSVELGLKRPPPPPRVWQAFPFLKRYHGGIRSLVSRSDNLPEYPRLADVDPDAQVENDGEGDKERKGLKRDLDEKRRVKRVDRNAVPPSVVFNPYTKATGVEPCFLDANDTIRIPAMRAYEGVVDGTPDNVMGSYELLGLRKDVCFERFGRLGPYGLGYGQKLGGLGAALEGDREGAESVWKEHPAVDYRAIKWGEALERCLEKNDKRFKPMPGRKEQLFQAKTVKAPDVEKKVPTPSAVPTTNPNAKRQLVDAEEKNERGTVHIEPKADRKLPRTAVLIRTWTNYEYDEEDILFLRAMISELSLQSGGEYVVHFLIHVKDNDKQIWADEAIYQKVLKESLPEEFEGMGTLWSERQMYLIYGGMEDSKYRNLPLYGNYRSTFMPVTYFAHQHPEFDYFWHWEMDIRYTGHYYHLFQQVAQWSDKQPRKGLWERNSRFYVPATHGSWDDFSQMVRVQTEHGTNSQANKWSSHLPPNPNMPEPETQKPEKPIWGPEIPADYPDIEIDPLARPPHSIVEDKGEWGVGEPADLIVFNPLFDPDHTNWILNEDVTGFNRTHGFPPRRTAINTAGRLSRRLLITMHREQSVHRHSMFSEMWPASCALHHGLKAVYAPHPVYVDRKWPVQYLAAIFNNGRNGASGGARLSVFSDERQHNFLGTTWYYHAGFAPNLWKRWLGYKVDNDGGEQEELANEGRMCLPGVLLHPVKQVEMVIESSDRGPDIVD